MGFSGIQWDSVGFIEIVCWIHSKKKGVQRMQKKNLFGFPAEVEIVCIHVNAGYARFVFGMHAGDTLWNLGIHM